MSEKLLFSGESQDKGPYFTLNKEDIDKGLLISIDVEVIRN